MMNSTHSPKNTGSQASASNLKHSRALLLIQTLSRAVTALFIIALIWTTYQAVINRNPLPLWAWLGMVALLAVVIGLGVAFFVYRSVSTQTGPFDFHPSSQAQGKLQTETRRVATDGATASFLFC